MINNVAFTGRENLIKPLETQVIKASTYIEEKLAPKAIEPQVVKASTYIEQALAPVVAEAPSTKPVINRTGLDFFA